MNAAEAKAAFKTVGLRAKIIPGTKYNTLVCSRTAHPRYVYMADALLRPRRYEDTLIAIAYKNAATAQACATSLVTPEYVIQITGVRAA